MNKIYLYGKDLNEPKYQSSVKTREGVGIKHLNDPKAFIEYSQYMGDLYNNINYNNPNRKRNILIVLHDIIADILTNKKIEAIIKELFLMCRTLISCINVSLVFFTQSYFSVPKEVRLNSTHYLIMKIPSKNELRNIAINRSADIDYKDFMTIYRKCTSELYFFLTINTTLPAHDFLRFRKNLLDSL